MSNSSMSISKMFNQSMPTLTSLQRVLLAAVLLSGLFACSQHPTQDAADKQVNPLINPVNFYDDTLGKRVIVENVQLQKEKGLSTMYARLVNNWHSEIDLEYRVVWFDRNDLEIDPESRGWKPLHLGESANHSVTSTAPRESAHHFELQIKPKD